MHKFMQWNEHDYLLILYGKKLSKALQQCYLWGRKKARAKPELLLYVA